MRLIIMPSAMSQSHTGPLTADDGRCGAFKTNRRNSAQIGLFVTREAAAKMPHRSKNAVHHPIAAASHKFCNEQVRGVAIFSNRSDSP
jgi:hypothetical protein